ncbi:MAG: DNA-processing protein DprA [Candidatus Dadabacteria bacterium]|nr:DNA-processing protein DprA [Candidatus Dadabacteria bacterium]
MSEKLLFEPEKPELPSVSAFREMGAYEALWSGKGMSFKRLAEMRRGPESILSDFVDEATAYDFAGLVRGLLADAGIDEFGVRVYGTWEYPEGLRDAAHPLELLYFQGSWDLVYTRSVSVVGTRNPSAKGKARTRSLVKKLVKDGFTIVSGLASGIDTVAHTAAIRNGGWTIAVIGTPLSETYPKENAELQKRIAKEHLLISQIPVWRYSQQGPQGNRFFFPQRNVTMSALAEATVIVEAGETSGTRFQAEAAIEQGRKVFILDSCFRNAALTWPEKFERKGAVRVADYEDIRRHLGC